MSDHIIETRGLTVYYGRQRGIIDLDLTVDKGEVFGFLGPNGAGKTTTQRTLMDIIRPVRGEAHIFGLNTRTDGVEIRKRVGYLPGELSLPQSVRGRRYLDTVEAIRGVKVDPLYRRELAAQLDLDVSRRIRDYSHGNKQKLGLVATFMTRPELLILDEPTTGLDPLVQRSVLDLVVEATSEGRTVFFSSHNLPEVQAVATRVAMIRRGRLISVDSMDTFGVKNLHRMTIAFEREVNPSVFEVVEGVNVAESGFDNTYTFEIRQNLGALMELAARFSIVDIETERVSLEETFMAYYGRNNNQNGETAEEVTNA